MTVIFIGHYINYGLLAQLNVICYMYVLVLFTIATCMSIIVDTFWHKNKAMITIILAFVVAMWYFYEQVVQFSEVITCL